jgi:hypothetical protein
MNIHYGLLDRYLDNLLAMPIILHLLKAEKIWLFKKVNTYQLTPLEILMTTVYVAIVTELIFPVLSENFTSDWADVFFYFAGSLIYYLSNKSTP